MRIETSYQEGLKKLIKEHDLDEINVVMLCNEVNSNRQTFYYHFRDISDVVQSIMLKEEIKTKCTTFEECVSNVLAYINSNYSFICAINKSFCSVSVEEFFYHYFYKKISNFLDKENKTYQESLRLLCTLYSKELCFWISTRRREKQPHLLKRFMTIYEFFSKEYKKEMEK